jgi:hypothetical protein
MVATISGVGDGGAGVGEGLGVSVASAVGVAVGGNHWLGVATGVASGGEGSTAPQAVRTTHRRTRTDLSVCFTGFL